MTERRRVSQLLLKGKFWLSLSKTEIFILGRTEQMWLGRNVNVKIGRVVREQFIAFEKKVDDDFLTLKNGMKMNYRKKSYLESY